MYRVVEIKIESQEETTQKYAVLKSDSNSSFVIKEYPALSEAILFAKGLARKEATSFVVQGKFKVSQPVFW